MPTAMVKPDPFFPSTIGNMFSEGFFGYLAEVTYGAFGEVEGSPKGSKWKVCRLQIFKYM